MAITASIAYTSISWIIILPTMHLAKEPLQQINQAHLTALATTCSLNLVVMYTSYYTYYDLRSQSTSGMIFILFSWFKSITLRKYSLSLITFLEEEKKQLYMILMPI